MTISDKILMRLSKTMSRLRRAVSNLFSCTKKFVVFTHGIDHFLKPGVCPDCREAQFQGEDIAKEALL